MNTRRAMLIGGGTLLAGAAIATFGGKNLFYSALTETTTGGAIDALTAHQLGRDKEILLVDIRRPDEWKKTGSGVGAVRLDMRREDFVDQLKRLTNGQNDTPVALICARGVRSARMSNRLNAAGFTKIIDVPEGMLGSAAGPGWINRGLPLDKS